MGLKAYLNSEFMFFKKIYEKPSPNKQTSTPNLWAGHILLKSSF